MYVLFLVIAKFAVQKYQIMFVITYEYLIIKIIYIYIVVSFVVYVASTQDAPDPVHLVCNETVPLVLALIEKHGILMQSETRSLQQVYSTLVSP